MLCEIRDRTGRLMMQTDSPAVVSGVDTEGQHKPGF